MSQIEKLIHVVCVESGISQEQLVSPCRKREFVTARKALVYCCYEKLMLGIGVVQLGNRVNRDHSSIIHLRDKAIEEIELLDDLSDLVDSVMEGFEQDEYFIPEPKGKTVSTKVYYQAVKILNSRISELEDLVIDQRLQIAEQEDKLVQLWRMDEIQSESKRLRKVLIEVSAQGVDLKKIEQSMQV